MSIKQAIWYPIRNLRRIFIISLGFTIIVTGLFEFAIYLDINVDEGNGFFIAIVIVLIFSALIFGFILFSLGYGMRMIRYIQQGDNRMPSIEPIRDLGRGIMIGFAGFITSLPLLFVSLIIVPIMNQSITLGILLVGIPVVFGLYLLCGLIVGIKQYAKYSKASCLFDVAFNFEVVHKNRLEYIGLIGYYIIISSIYILLWSSIQTLINIMFHPTAQNESTILMIASIFMAGVFYLVYISILHRLAVQCDDVSEKTKLKRTA